MHVLLLTVAKGGLLSSAASCWCAKFKTLWQVGTRVCAKQQQGRDMRGTIMSVNPKAGSLKVSTVAGNQIIVATEDWRSATDADFMPTLVCS